MDPLASLSFRRVISRIVRLADSHTHSAKDFHATILDPRETMRQTEARVCAQIQEMAQVEDIHLIGKPEITWRCEVTWQGLEKPEDVEHKAWRTATADLRIDAPDRLRGAYILDVPVLDTQDYSK